MSLLSLSRLSLVVVYGYLADFLAKSVDVVFQGDVLQESVFKDSLELLVDLQAEFKSHPRVRDLAVVKAGHDALTCSNLSLQHLNSR